jgi:hypothetical protein
MFNILDNLAILLVHFILFYKLLTSRFGIGTQDKGDTFRIWKENNSDMKDYDMMN